jgi:hypothetical protein
MTELLLLLLLHAAETAAVQVPPPEVWEHADVATKRIEPAVFPGIPRWLTTELTRRHCSIPQSFGAKSPHKIIRGFFNDGNLRDWAVLCSRERVSTILVFWDEQTQNVAELASAPDANSLQVVRPGEIGFSRAIGVATPTSIRGYHSAFGDGVLPPLSHSGINDGFVGKGSVVWNWHQGTWLRLTGAD